MRPIDSQVAIEAIQNFILFGDIELDAPSRQKAARSIQIIMEMLPEVELEQKKATWIPVTERLPKYGIDVLTVDRYGEYEINHIIDEEDGEWYWEKPVAWMPLPEPWKGETDE